MIQAMGIVEAFERRAQEHERRMAEDVDYQRQVAAQEAERVERERASRRLRLIDRGIPAKDLPRIVGGALDDTHAMREARAFMASDELRILVLSGKRGCGKTTAAGWACANALSGRFLDVSRLQRVDKYDGEAMDNLERVGLLVVDDLGMEYADTKGNFLSVVDGVINSRYAADLRTVVTTNLTAEAFKARYGERVADRIREVGRFVECAGESLRGKAA